MKPFRLLGIAASAAFLALSSFGVPMAAAAEEVHATVLCNAFSESDECASEGNIYASGTSFSATSTNLTITTKILGSPETITCAKSTLSGETTESIDTAELWGSITGLTFSECKDTVLKASCTIEATGLPYETAISSMGGGAGDGDLEIWNESAPPKFKANCGGGSLKCSYETTESTELEGVEGSVKAIHTFLDGGTPGILKVENAQLKVPASEGLLCTAGTTATVSASYTFAEPNPVFVEFVPIKVNINPEPIPMTLNNSTKVTVTNLSPKAVVTVTKMLVDVDIGSTNTVDKKTCVAPTNVLDPTDKMKNSCEFSIKCNAVGKEDFTVEYVTSWKTQIQRLVKAECTK